MSFTRSDGQTAMPEILLKSPVKDQLNYIEEKTRIYENYRAVREDMFQQLKGNISDSFLVANKKISSLNILTSSLNNKIDSLKSSLETTKTGMEDAIRTKNSITIIGAEVNKLTYNTILWTIVGILVAILVIGFLAFKRNLLLTISNKKELEDLKREFDTYRKTTREAREKMSMDHFNEIKKLKGG
jgi:hypothetical protein